MMDNAPTFECQLCLRHFSGVANRVCAMALCDCCEQGDISAWLADHGFDIHYEAWTEVIPSGNSASLYYCQRIESPIRNKGDTWHGEVTFSREDLGTRISNFLGFKDLQAGDQLFDDTIFIKTDKENSTTLQALLRTEPFQHVIMEAVGHRGSFKIADSQLTLCGASKFQNELLSELDSIRLAAIALRLIANA